MRGDNRQKVLDFIRISHPKSVTSADIVRRTGVSQPQVYQIAKALMESGLVRAARKGRVWHYTWNKPCETASRQSPAHLAKAVAQAAQAHFAARYGTPLQAREHSPSVVLLSGENCAGFALYFTPLQGKPVPQARPAIINGHLWLLEKSEMDNLFAALGGDAATIDTWAENFASLCLDVEVVRVTDEGEIIPLT